jgi:cytochrome P450
MEFNPLTPEVREDPYPFYAYLRRHAPVYQVAALGCWAISRYEDVVGVLKDPATFSSAALMTAIMGGDLNPVPGVPYMIGSDPPVHTRLRRLVNRAFTPRAVGEMEARIKDITRQLIADLDGRDEFDLVTELSTPLPVIVIAEMLGIEPERRRQFKHWSDDLVAVTSGAVAGDERDRIARSMAEFVAYLGQTIERRRVEPGNDLITGLVKAEEENQALTAPEILAMTLLLLVAGNETTTNLISNAALALLKHPGEMAKLRARPDLVPNAIEETLRYDGPVQMIFRQTTREVMVAGIAIPAGAFVMPLYASANHDERVFADPERFEVTRDASEHIAFGLGIHYCLGANLARLEARIVLEEMLKQIGDLERIDAVVERINSLIVRGPKSLRLRRTARP